MNACVVRGDYVTALSLWRGWIEFQPAAEPLDGVVYRTARMPSLAIAVAEEFGVSVALLRGPSARHAIAHPRQELMLRASEAGLSLGQIGRYLGGRDHTTVLYGLRRARARRAGRLEVAARAGGFA